jgi:hypothetical protein
MDKQFARILMLSVLLPAGANMAKAIDHEYVTAAASHPGFVSQLAVDTSADSNHKKSIEGRRFMQVIATEEDAVLRHRGVEGPAQSVLVAGHRK